MDEPKRSPTTQAGNDELWRIHAERYRRLYGPEPPPVEAPKPPKPKARRPKSRRPAQRQAKPPVAGEPPATFKQIDLLLSLGADPAHARRMGRYEASTWIERRFNEIDEARIEAHRSRNRNRP